MPASSIEKLRERRERGRPRPVATLTVECTIGAPNRLAGFVVEAMFTSSGSSSIGRTDAI